MRQDLDRLMRERGLAGLVIVAADRYAPALLYSTGQHLHHALYFRAADGRAHLIHDPMERDQAARAGCEMSSFGQHRVSVALAEEGSMTRVYGRWIGETCALLGMRGRIALHGEMDAGRAWEMIARARRELPELEIDDATPDLLQQARATKDADEIARMRKASLGTVDAMRHVKEYLEHSRISGDKVVHGGGLVTLGRLRQIVRETFLAHGLAESGDGIIAQGRDAGVPHNRGNDDDVVRPGAPIIVDLFPGEAGGGYFSDMTRTFCVGPASDELRRTYADVHDAFRQAMDTLALGERCRSYQEKTCALFESRGHRTPLSHPGTEEGYVHGLGHGVGLAVHEAPSLGGPPSNTATIAPGHAITIEPGLYYPERGIGVRIEDLVVARADGTFENLTEFPVEMEVVPRG